MRPRPACCGRSSNGAESFEALRRLRAFGTGIFLAAGQGLLQQRFRLIERPGRGVEFAQIILALRKIGITRFQQLLPQRE